MEATNTRDELDSLVRALSHDMSANFMLLESSFAQLKRSLVRAPHAGLSYAARAHGTVHSQVSHVEACLRESRRFLDDLVRLAQTGNVEMEPARTEVAKVVEAVLFEQRELLRHRSVEVKIEGPLPVVWCNEGRLKQIVSNLLRNAVYHGCDRKRPLIVVSPAESPPTGVPLEKPPAEFPPKTPAAMAAFAVRDNGRGIDPRMHREIFLPGRRLPAAHTEGSGMGLAIVKKIVDHYGGAVYVDPQCRQGTSLVVALPAAEFEPVESPRAGSRFAGTDRQWKLEPDGHSDRHPVPLHGTRAAQATRHG